MKIELIKYTKALTGEVYYYTSSDGVMVSNTFSSDIESANAHFNDVIEKAKLFPVNVYEPIKAVEI